MPIPVPVIIAVSALAASGGIAGIIHGGKKAHSAQKDLEVITEEHNANMKHLESVNESAALSMDKLGTLELEICESFDKFSDAFERIKNKPEFDVVELGNLSIEKFQPDELKEVSVGAGVLLGALGGAGTGTAGGFAAAGAVQAAVVALGTASTGTPIAALSGQAAVNATLAALGGGSLAAGGGGMALGSIVLGVAAAGVGILVGGVIFSIAGHVISGKVEDARKQKDEAAEQIAKICLYLDELKTAAERYYSSLKVVNDIYQSHLSRFQQVIYVDGKTDWNVFDDKERLTVENLVLLVSVLYHMCKVNLVIPSDEEGGLNSVNQDAIDAGVGKMDQLMEDRGWAAR